MEMQPRSRLMEAIHDSAQDMYRQGAIDTERMERYDLLCLEPLRNYDSDKIKSIRQRFNLSQVLLASLLNISVSTVRQWEQGVKKPSGACQKLLSILDTKGLDPLVQVH
ncbi:helix-turn-helix domain-containing protein [Thiomicrospira microaerophila]|uniref:helix-turn-helix domain-containing protein n=1 Tax=Thiomicrospira microaerophila TaxID=406020 RepID=UPI0018E07DF5|nr:helix-turn-helix domain-containing protein [Thiomicrospira microaerophila]